MENPDPDEFLRTSPSFRTAKSASSSGAEESCDAALPREAQGEGRARLPGGSVERRDVAPDVRELRVDVAVQPRADEGEGQVGVPPDLAP